MHFSAVISACLRLITIQTNAADEIRKAAGYGIYGAAAFIKHDLGPC